MNNNKYSITYILKKYRLNDNGEATVYLKLKVGNSKLELSTNQFIKPECWNNKTYTVIDTEDSTTKNALLDKKRSELEQKINHLILSGTQVTINGIRRLVK